MSKTAKDLVNDTEPAKRLWRLVLDLTISASECKDARLDFIARQFQSALTDVWRELEKMGVEKDETR